ncbi:MAG: TonB-dependent receptor [Saprospiraceae bacterium]
MSRYTFNRLLPFFTFLFLTVFLNAQTTLTGTITDKEGNTLSGASLYIDALSLGTLSDNNGQFELIISERGSYDLEVSYLGLRTNRQLIEIGNSSTSLNIQLAPDPLKLESVIVTGTFNEASRLTTSTASSTLSQKDIQNAAALGTAELLGKVTGTFVDASAGSIFTKVYSRGISASAEDDIGWYYVSLQEDGLPVTNYHTTYYEPNLFHRVDLTTRRLEAVRGGSAMITSANAPGGIFNFISKTGEEQFGGQMMVTGALQGENNPLFRYDLNLGGLLGNNGLTYNIGGFYRYDQGARNTDVTWENGGQLKANISKKTKNGFVKIYGKYLNDKVNRYQGLAATNWKDPQPAFGQDFNNTALNLPKLSTDISDGRVAGNDANATYNYDTDNGVKTKDAALGLDIAHGVNGWTIRSNFKVSNKSADWNATIANQPLGLEGFFPYLLSGIDPTFQNIPLGQIVFRDARSSEVVARVNNFGILGPFQGQPASFEYLEGSLPNDALLGIAPWKKIDEATEFMEQLTISKQVANHSITGGAYFAYSDIESFTSASFAYATYENTPRSLYVTLENPDAPVLELSDRTGISNHGGLLYNRGDAKISQFALFLNDNIQIGDKLNIDGGLRYENIGHKGEKDRGVPTFNPGGIDGDETTAYNNSVLTAGQQDPFDFSYDYLSWSLGANYLLSEDMALFGRLSNGHKAPEMNYYFNNFGGVPIDRAGTVQDIFQGELGVKVVTDKFSLFTTAFYSQLDNIAFSEFVLDQQTGGIFFTPIQLNKTTTVGLEVESNLALTNNFDITVKATFQNPEATRFNVYNANETVDSADDNIVDYSGNTVPHNPKTMLEITPNYKANKFNVFATWRYMGEREGNVGNTFQLPSFSTINAGIGYQLNQQVNISLIANNLFNSTGLMNFFGPNEFGSNSNAATTDFINQNPNASFVVFPISPRSIFLKVGYDF